MTTPAQNAISMRERQQRRQIMFLMAPATFWLVVFFLLPLAIILTYSFLQRGTYGGVEWQLNNNYVELLDRNYFIIFRRSIVLATVTTLICLVVSYPAAYFITRQSATWRGLLLVLVIVPFWTNFLVRTYAWIVLLRTEGIINYLLQALGFIDEPLQMLFTPGAVLVGMVYGFLPFMILPLYATLEKFDHALIEAAHDAGANEFWAFVRVMVPLTMPGIVAGSILVFVPSIGAFVTPDILGGAKAMMIGNLIDQQFKSGHNWPFASTVSIGLMVIVSIATALYFRVTSEEDRT